MTDPDPRPAPMPQRLRELARENFALLGVWTELTHVGWLERVDAAIDATWQALAADLAAGWVHRSQLERRREWMREEVALLDLWPELSHEAWLTNVDAVIDAVIVGALGDTKGEDQ